MTTMIERVARALLAHQVETGQCEEDIPWQSFLGEARAVLEALREPTGAMIDSGANTLWPPTTKTLDGQPSKCWQAMITAALAGEAEG